MPLLETFVASRYVGAYNSVNVGITEEGFELTTQSSAELIGMSDAYGDSVIDGVYRGGNYFMMFNCLAYKTGSLSPFWPYASALGQMGTIGRMWTDIARPMVITAQLAVAPASLTGSYTMLAENFDARLQFNSKLRKVPNRLRLLPWEPTSGVPFWYTLV